MEILIEWLKIQKRKSDKEKVICNKKGNEFREDMVHGGNDMSPHELKVEVGIQ